MAKILMMLWLSHPNWFKPICWLFRHKWHKLNNNGTFVNDYICLRCADGKPEDLRIQDYPR